MRMMVFLSIESCLGFIEPLEEPHYHCGPEESCPEACPYRGCLMRGQRKGEKEFKHLKVRCFQSAAQTPAVNVLT